jgi:tetratricopeptide (TPR) repeat protein
MRRFTAAPARLLDDPAHAPADYHDGLTVAKAFDLAIAQAAALHPACRNLLQVAALLAPEPIPVFLFREGREALGETLATQLAGDGLDTALAALRNFALISREMVPDERDPALRTDCLRLHRLVRQVAVAGLSRDAVAEGAKTLIAALAAVYPRGVYNNVRERPQARRLDALALPLVAPPAAIPSGAERTACVLLDGLASFRHAHAAFGVARPLFERAHALARQVAGRDDKMTAQTLNNLALLLRDHGDPAAAQNLFTEALAIRETMFGPDHPEVAVSLNNLGNAFSDQGDHGAARPCFERALAIWERAYGASDPMTARAMNNLARQLHFLGDLGAARPLMERALAARETCLGPFHRDTANSLQNLALVRLDLGDVEAARELFERALRVADEAVGAAHPDTAGIRAYMARCLLAAGAREQALALAERALADLLAALAPGAPITRMAATVSAACLDALGQAGDAARLRQRHSLPPPSG